MITRGEELKEILTAARSIAVVGASPKLERPVYSILLYLRDQGYRVYPVNPLYANIDDLVCYPDLEALPERPDIVNLFIRSERVFPVVEAALKMQVPVIWMQDGVINWKAAAAAEKQGARVVVDDCIYRRHRSLLG